MLDRFRSFIGQFLNDPGEVRLADDAQVAAVALMCHVMAADGMIEEEERSALQRVVAERYGLDAAAARSLIAQAGESDRAAVDLYDFSSLLKRRLTREERLSLVRAIWEVVYADGGVHELEDSVVWRIADLLGLDQDEQIALKQAVRRDA